MNESDGSAIVANILAQVELELDGVRHLLKQQLILLTPASWKKSVTRQWSDNWQLTTNKNKLIVFSKVLLPDHDMIQLTECAVISY